MSIKDTYLKRNISAMKQIWAELSKKIHNDVEHVVFNEADIHFLYEDGLVDATRFQLEEWRAAWQGFLKKGEFYWATYDQFVGLAKYRYGGSVREPFDPLKLRQGPYTIERLWKVYENSIIPSTSLPREFIKDLFDKRYRQRQSIHQIFDKEIKEMQTRGEDTSKIGANAIQFMEKGEVIVTEIQLRQLKEILDAHPSPRRRLEMGVQEIRHKELTGLARLAKDHQKSTFSSGKDVRSKAQASLTDVLLKASNQNTTFTENSKESIDINQLKKKGSRGPVKF